MEGRAVGIDRRTCNPSRGGRGGGVQPNIKGGTKLLCEMIASVAALQEFPNKTKCLTHVPPIAAIAKIVPSHPRHPRVSLTRGSHLGDLGLVRCGQISIAGSLGLALLGLRGRGGQIGVTGRRCSACVCGGGRGAY